MYLEKLETQGFKTFAAKTYLEFPPPRSGKRGIAAIVGPNGSGKSNLADAVRWVLGEQSMKLLRGKKSEDIIFSGTENRARSGFAETTLTLNNEDKSAPIEFTSLAISRRLYRDGNSEYLINGKVVRLADIQLLLAQANFGQRTYSVIGQGMVDHILVASPQERKEFFDEAAGVKQFQLKRDQAVNKLQTTKENLAQADQLVREIEPRLRSLSRQVKKLEEREPIEKEMQDLGRAYYGKIWRELQANIRQARTKSDKFELDRKTTNEAIQKIRNELAGLEKEETQKTGFVELQKEYEKLADARNNIREEVLKIQNAISFAKLQQNQDKTVPMARVVSEIESVVTKGKNFLTKLEDVKNLETIKELQQEFREIISNTEFFLKEITGNKSDASTERFTKQKSELDEKLNLINKKINDLQAKIRDFGTQEQKSKGRLFELQHELQKQQNQLFETDRQLNDLRVQLARDETQRNTMEQEIKFQLGKEPDELAKGDLPELSITPFEAAEKIRRMKTQLDVIGSIDPEVIKEHDETKERCDFLKTQIEDLIKAMSDLESGIIELDEIIEKQTEKSFGNLSREFDKYFKVLFGNSGHAELSKTKPVDEPELEDSENGAAEEESKIKIKKSDYNGIEITANPPGKRVKSINMLSGGERALTSIALICAIMAENPSPFVVLDEVDAALDESNSIKFAQIIDDLSHKTQFIVISHNRATMEKANILYGVTMNNDGASHLLSLKLEDVENLRNTKKAEL